MEQHTQCRGVAVELFERCRHYAPVAVLETMARELGISVAEARAQLLEVKRFMCLCASSPGERLATSRRLDEAWHCFILNTALYASFCDEFLGTFVHHRPTAKPETHAYGRSLELLAALFPEHDSRYWPPIRSQASDCDSGVCQGYCSCGTCEGGCASNTVHGTRLRKL